jgi:hypothetical protein
MAAIASRLVPHPPAAGQALPFLESHVQALQETRRAVVSNDCNAARLALARFNTR